MQDNLSMKKDRELANTLAGMALYGLLTGGIVATSIAKSVAPVHLDDNANYSPLAELANEVSSSGLLFLGGYLICYLMLTTRYAWIASKAGKRLFHFRLDALFFAFALLALCLHSLAFTVIAYFLGSWVMLILAASYAYFAYRTLARERFRARLHAFFYQQVQ